MKVGSTEISPTEVAVMLLQDALLAYEWGAVRGVKYGGCSFAY